MSLKIAGGLVAACAALSACVTPSNLAVHTELVEIKGEVLGVSQMHGPGPAQTSLTFETRNVSHKGEKRPGEDTVWYVDVRTSLLEAAGVTQADLVKGKITVVGYRFVDPFCCNLAGRQIRLENGCVLFVGLSNADYAERRKVKDWNIPEDGLDAAGQPGCGKS